MATEIFFPLDVQRILCLEDRQISIYINPKNNMDYVIYENKADDFIVSDPTCNYVYEGNHTIVHTPPPNVSATSSRKRKRVDNADGRNQAHVKRNAVPFRLMKPGENKMTLQGFIDHCAQYMSKHCTTADLATIYQVLEPYTIDEKVLDVIRAAIQLMSTKTLVNTMRRNCDRRNKKFKKQLQFVLSAMCKKHLC